MGPSDEIGEMGYVAAMEEVVAQLAQTRVDVDPSSSPAAPPAPSS